MTEEPLAVNVQPAFVTQARRFLVRVCTALIVTASLGLLVQHQVRLVESERILDHPIMVALDTVDVSIHATELRATALVRRGSLMSMAELKGLATRLAGSGRALDGVELWSEVQPQYSVVYFRGSDEAGGSWTASARYLDGGDPSEGRIEVALQRELVGRLDDVRNALHEMRGRLQRAAGLPLNAVELETSIQGRPSSREAYSERLISDLMRLMGVEAFSSRGHDATFTAQGYSPRLATTVSKIQGERTNVMIRLSRRGQGPWIEVGTPAL